MPGPYTTFLRSNSDAPGANAFHYYFNHSSGLCHLGVWRPKASFQNAPVIVFVHGGLGYNPGWRAMESIMQSAKTSALCTALSAKGWVVISIDYPACAANQHNKEGDNGDTFRLLGSWFEMHPVAMWPEQAAYIALAVQYLKTHATAVSTSPDYSPLAAQMFGAGNSIDGENIFLWGDSWGCTSSMYIALQPTGYYPFDEGGWGTTDLYIPRKSHRVRGVSGISPQFDLTQFYVDTASNTTIGNSLGPIYQRDRLQPFMRTEGTRKWSTLPNREKKQSPYWLMQEYLPENENVSFFIEYLGSGVTGISDNLTANDWSPGSTRNDVAGLKAWVDPHDGKFQGPPTKEAVQSYGSTTNSPMRQSYIGYSTSVGGTILSLANYPSRWLQWAGALGVPEQFL
jgi:hypothetical protein